MSPDPVSVHVEDRLSKAAQKMAEVSIRHLPVVDRDGVLIGLISHRDLLGVGDLHGKKVADVMRTDVKAVAPNTFAHEAAYLLLHYKIGCLPITDAGGKLIGIVTESDFVRVAYALLGGRVPIGELETEDDEAERQ